MSMTVETVTIRSPASRTAHLYTSGTVLAASLTSPEDEVLGTMVTDYEDVKRGAAAFPEKCPPKCQRR